MSDLWDAERGVLPSQWLEAHPEECDKYFAMRQYFYLLSDPHLATRFRARVGIIWLAKTRLCLGGRVEQTTRQETLRRFRAVEAAMGLTPVKEDKP